MPPSGVQLSPEHPARIRLAALHRDGTLVCRTVPLNSPITVEGARVTFLDANHCPGAAMILFEPPGRRPVLHTGACRAARAAAAACCACVGRRLETAVALLGPLCCQSFYVGLSVSRTLVILFTRTDRPLAPAGDCRLIPEMQQEEVLARVR